MDLNLSEIINEVLDRRALDTPRDYIGASSIGNDCARAIWYQAKGIQENSLNNRIKRIFDNGKIIEQMLLNYIIKSHVKVVLPSEENNYLSCSDPELPYFKGHLDALLIFPSMNPIVLDIKTCKDTSFKQFVSQGLKSWSIQYYSQLQAYMGMKNLKFAILLAYNKNDSKLHDECISFDADYYEKLKQKASSIFSCTEPPERINKSPLYYKCSYCTYKTVCHALEPLNPLQPEFINQNVVL